MSNPFEPQLPFIWPDLVNRASNQLPFDAVARTSASIFGIVSNLDAEAVDWIAGYLANNQDCKMRLVISIYPTCRTTNSDLEKLLQLTEHPGKRADFRVFPEASLYDRSSNLLCLCSRDGNAAITIGSTENMGFTDCSRSQANLVCSITATTLETCRKWFDELWKISGPLRSEVATIPQLVLPKGDIEAARLWEDYRARCLEGGNPIIVKTDDDTGEVIQSPTEEIGIPKLDALADSLARLFDLGMLVTVDKGSRVPPLEAPVKPEWFGVDSFRQTGMVRAQTSIKVAPFDEVTMRKINQLKNVSGDLLPRYSFALADGARWMPKKAIPLFEAALSAANDEAERLLGVTVGKDIDAFLNSQHKRISDDAQRMYEILHPGRKIPDNAVDKIIDELKNRLGKTRGVSLIPRMNHSPITFNPTVETQWSSQWGQAFRLLISIAEFPREAMTNLYFWRGIRTNQTDLVKAMNVADDYIVAEYGRLNAAQRAKDELGLIKKIEASPADASEKCKAIWDLIKSGDDTVANELLAADN